MILWRKRMKTFIILFLSLLVAGDLWASAVSNRPTNTNSAEAIGKGNMEIAFGFDIQQKRNKDKDTVFVTDISYGASENVELGLKFPYVFNDPKGGDKESNLGQVNVLALWNFEKENKNTWKPSVSVSSQLYFKTTDFARNTDTDGEDIDFFLIFSKYFGNHNLELNLGYILFGDNSGGRDSIGFNFADEWEALSWLTIVAEFYGNTDNDIGENEFDTAAQIGFVFNFIKNISIDIGYNQGFAKAGDGSTDTLIRTGLAWNF